MLHHGTIKKYTSALLDLFNDFEVQYTDSKGNVISKNIPVRYSSKEKAHDLDKHTSEQLLSGNYNVLPRANLALSSMVKSDARVKNKNLKINTYKTEDTFEYMYNSVPYEFTFELSIMCRGMNEATMIIEQVAPKFNPTVNIDIWDASNLNEPTRVPVRLLDIEMASNGYDELSSNIVTVGFGLSIMGNLYPPIKSTARVRDFKMLINETDGQYFDRKTIMNWDVNDDGIPMNEDVTRITDFSDQHAPTIIDIVGDNVSLGLNNLSVIYEDKDNKLSELVFEWDLLSGGAILNGDLDTAVLDVSVEGDVEVQVTITDAYGNYTSLSKVFTV